ncbi:unnamed protein product [Leuciscus chuanchicus]
MTLLMCQVLMSRSCRLARFHVGISARLSGMKGTLGEKGPTGIFPLLESHPLSLCNTSEDERQEPDFISIVKLESPESNVPQCQPLLDKVRLMGKHTQTHIYEHLLVVRSGRLLASTETHALVAQTLFMELILAGHLHSGPGMKRVSSSSVCERREGAGHISRRDGVWDVSLGLWRWT